VAVEGDFQIESCDLASFLFSVLSFCFFLSLASGLFRFRLTRFATGFPFFFTPSSLCFLNASLPSSQPSFFPVATNLSTVSWTEERGLVQQCDWWQHDLSGTDRHPCQATGLSNSRYQKEQVAIPQQTAQQQCQEDSETNSDGPLLNFFTSMTAPRSNNVQDDCQKESAADVE